MTIKMSISRVQFNAICRLIDDDKYNEPFGKRTKRVSVKYIGDQECGEIEIQTLDSSIDGQLLEEISKIIKED